MENQEAGVAEVVAALEAKGLHVHPLTDQVLNVHNDDVTDEATYLFTVTVTVTP